ncbi:HNH endonuclease [Rudaeicoccus suwonensis]|nr:HNH endonuclease [Rudaeicoccus suwonensis]
MDWLRIRTNDGLDALTSEEILEFQFQGEPRRLAATQQGIWKPHDLPAALAIRTTYRAEGQERPYDDNLGVDGLFRYKWRGDDPLHSDNRALRAAKDLGKPLIWWWGVGKAVYKPIFPIYLIDEEITQQQFVVATDGLQELPETGSAVEEVLRRYIQRETLQRLHQPVFRSMVMRAYGTRCSVCELGHSVLLDAAHIVEDRHELGVAAIRNGLALCKIHHSAYDAGILGVTPDLTIKIRSDILQEVDGPLLEHGLKALNNTPLRVVPKVRKERPDPELLEIHYQKFIAS